MRAIKYANTHYIFILTILSIEIKQRRICVSQFCELVMGTMDDKTPQQLLIEHLDYIKRIVKKINNLRNYGLTEEEIDDIFQTVCEKLLDKGFTNYKGNSKIETYIFKIIHNEIITFAKNKEKKEVVITEKVARKPIGDDSEEDDDYGNKLDLLTKFEIDYVDKIFRKDIIKIIDKTLSTFDDKDKLIFTWYFLCKHPQVLIAKMLKLSQPTVYERIEKIKKRIIEAIKKKYPEVEEEILS